LNGVLIFLTGASASTLGNTNFAEKKKANPNQERIGRRALYSKAQSSTRKKVKTKLFVKKFERKMLDAIGKMESVISPPTEKILSAKAGRKVG